MRSGFNQVNFKSSAKASRLLCIYCGKRCAAFNSGKVCLSQPARIRKPTEKQFDRAFRDQAMHNSRIGDRNFFSAYTPHGIKMMDGLYCERAQNFTSSEEYEWIRRDLEENPHLDKLIKDNITLNLRNRVRDLRSTGKLLLHMKAEVWSLIPDVSDSRLYGVSFYTRQTFQKLVFKGSWGACQKKIKSGDLPRLKYPATYEITKPGGKRYFPCSQADSREPWRWKESGIEPYGKIRAMYVDVPKTDSDYRMDAFWENIVGRSRKTKKRKRI